MTKSLTLWHNLSINKYVNTFHLYTIREQLDAIFGLFLLVTPYRG
jgi:hypothetical protein